MHTRLRILMNRRKLEQPSGRICYEQSRDICMSAVPSTPTPYSFIFPKALFQPLSPIKPLCPGNSFFLDRLHATCILSRQGIHHADRIRRNIPRRRQIRPHAPLREKAARPRAMRIAASSAQPPPHDPIRQPELQWFLGIHGPVGQDRVPSPTAPGSLAVAPFRSAARRRASNVSAWICEPRESSRPPATVMATMRAAMGRAMREGPHGVRRAVGAGAVVIAGPRRPGARR